MLRIIVLLGLLFLMIAEPIIVIAKDLCQISPKALKIAEQLRGLEIKKEVPCQVKNKEEVLASLKEVIAREIPESKIINESKLFKALGIIPKEYDYLAGLLELYTSQLAGFYDPIVEYYVTAGWLPEIMQTPIAIHELTHALQDQHFKLDDFISGKLTTDESLAHSAVAEGDATAITYDYVNQLRGKEKIQDSENVTSYVAETLLSAKLSGSLSKAPEALQAMLLFPYTSGLSFAHQIIKGKGYQELDKVYLNPVQTTAEILHPERYFNKEAFLKLDIGELAKFFSQELPSNSYQDRLGEFVLSLLLPVRDRYLASKWKGDLAVIDKDKVYWLISWQSQAAAETAKQIFINQNQAIESAIVRGDQLGLIISVRKEA